MSQVQCFEKALELKPEYAQAWNNLGVAGGGSVGGQEMEEIYCYQRALYFKHDFAEAWQNLGAAGGGTVAGRLVSAIECYQQALNLNRNDATTWYNLGVAGGGVVAGKQMSQGECYERSLELKPDFHEAPRGQYIRGQYMSDSQCLVRAALPESPIKRACCKSLWFGVFSNQSIADAAPANSETSPADSV